MPRDGRRKEPATPVFVAERIFALAEDGNLQEIFNTLLGSNKSTKRQISDMWKALVEKRYTAKMAHKELMTVVKRWQEVFRKNRREIQEILQIPENREFPEDNVDAVQVPQGGEANLDDDQGAADNLHGDNENREVYPHVAAQAPELDRQADEPDGNSDDEGLAAAACFYDPPPRPSLNDSMESVPNVEEVDLLPDFLIPLTPAAPRKKYEGKRSLDGTATPSQHSPIRYLDETMESLPDFRVFDRLPSDLLIPLTSTAPRKKYEGKRSLDGTTTPSEHSPIRYLDETTDSLPDFGVFNRLPSDLLIPLTPTASTSKPLDSQFTDDTKSSLDDTVIIIDSSPEITPMKGKPHDREDDEHGQEKQVVLSEEDRKDCEASRLAREMKLMKIGNRRITQ